MVSYSLFITLMLFIPLPLYVAILFPSQLGSPPHFPLLITCILLFSSLELLPTYISFHFSIFCFRGYSRLFIIVCCFGARSAKMRENSWKLLQQPIQSVQAPFIHDFIFHYSYNSPLCACSTSCYTLIICRTFNLFFIYCEWISNRHSWANICRAGWWALWAYAKEICSFVL